MTKNRHAERRRQVLVSTPERTDQDQANNMARAVAYLDATHDQFVASLGQAKCYFDGVIEGGALAGPCVRR